MPVPSISAALTRCSFSHSTSSPMPVGKALNCRVQTSASLSGPRDPHGRRAYLVNVKARCARVDDIETSFSTMSLPPLKGGERAEAGDLWTADMHRCDAVLFAVRPRIEPGTSRGAKPLSGTVLERARSHKKKASTSPLPRQIVQNMRQAGNTPPAPPLRAGGRRLNIDGRGVRDARIMAVCCVTFPQSGRTKMPDFPGRESSVEHHVVDEVWRFGQPRYMARRRFSS